MTQQEKIDKQLEFNKLWDKYGVELIDMVALRLMTLSSNQQHMGHTLLGLGYKTAGLKMQSAYAELQYAHMLDEFQSSVFE